MCLNSAFILNDYFFIHNLTPFRKSKGYSTQISISLIIYPFIKINLVADKNGIVGI